MRYVLCATVLVGLAITLSGCVDEEHVGPAPLSATTVTSASQAKIMTARAEESYTECNRASPSLTEPLDACPQGTLLLGRHILTSVSAVLYFATLRSSDWVAPFGGRKGRGTADQDVVVKYMNDCWHRLEHRGAAPKQHPLLVEYLFLTSLKATGLVPRPIYYSAPTTVPCDSHPLPDRIMSSFLQRKLAECTEAGTEVRFLVQERAGFTLNRYFDFIALTRPWLFVARRAVGLTIKVVQMLEYLHGTGVVHGDIHRRNILFKHTYNHLNDTGIDTDKNLVLIDFEYAVVRPIPPVPRGTPPVWMNLNPSLLSFWQLQGARLGPRDDVYRAIELLADVLGEGQLSRLYGEQSRRARTIASMGRLKDLTSLFESAVWRIDDPEVRSVVQDELDGIGTDQLTRCTEPDSVVDYGGIIDCLNRVLALL